VLSARCPRPHFSAARSVFARPTRPAACRIGACCARACVNESRRWREGRHFEGTSTDAEPAPPRTVRIEIVDDALDARVGREQPKGETREFEAVRRGLVDAVQTCQQCTHANVAASPSRRGERSQRWWAQIPSTRAVKACNAPRQFVGYSLLVRKASMVPPGSRRPATQKPTAALLAYQHTSNHRRTHASCKPLQATRRQGLRILSSDPHINEPRALTTAGWRYEKLQPGLSVET
jgi:hypothetical protein